MDTSTPHETYHLDIQTPSGDLRASVAVSTGFIPITDIIPLMRSLGEQAHQLAIDQTTRTGATISCQKGCAACCRMMIPLAPQRPLPSERSSRHSPPQKGNPYLSGFRPLKGPCGKPAWRKNYNGWPSRKTKAPMKNWNPSIRPTMGFGYPILSWRTKSAPSMNSVPPPAGNYW